MTSQLLAVDIGNSSIKLGRFGQLPAGELPSPKATIEFRSGQIDHRQLLEFLAGDAQPLVWCIGSVQRSDLQRLADWVETHRPQDVVDILSHQRMPIAIDLSAPQKVGMDRLAAAVAANVLRPADHGAIVIDTGSAMTIDVIDAAGTFLGGAILPGMKMSGRSLADGTDQLPEVHFDEQSGPPPILGKDTEAAIRSGVYWGAVGAVNEFIRRITRGSDTRHEILLSGAGSRFLLNQIDASARFLPHLVLAGIALARQRQAPQS